VPQLDGSAAVLGVCFGPSPPPLSVVPLPARFAHLHPRQTLRVPRPRPISPMAHRYSKYRRPTMAMSELEVKTLDHDATDVL
jgi:hypothetical protein